MYCSPGLSGTASVHHDVNRVLQVTSALGAKAVDQSIIEEGQNRHDESQFCVLRMPEGVAHCATLKRL